MAGGRLVVMTNSNAPIQGDCDAGAPWDKQIKLQDASLGAGASITLDDKSAWQGNVSQSNISVTLDNSGPWIAELQQALFVGQDLGDVTITELSQTNLAYGKVREIKLAKAWLSGMSVNMSGVSTTVSLEIAYGTCTVNWGDKVAFFHPEGKYA